MRAAILLPAVAAGLLLLSGCDIEDFSGARYNKDFHYGFPLNAGGKVTIETFNGGIEVSGWDQNNVDISGTKYGPTPEIADQVEVTVDHSPASVSVRVQRPSIHRGNIGAKFVVKVPRTAIVDYLSSSNGSIRVTDATGPARLRTSNGGIRVAGLSGGLEAHTSNGGITVRLPEGVDARVSAHTSNAHVTSDFDVRMQGEIERHRMEGVIGKGGPLLDLSTSNGSIRLARAL